MLLVLLLLLVLVLLFCGVTDALLFYGASVLWCLCYYRSVVLLI